MNLKILNELERVIKTSPQTLRNDFKLRQLIQATFNVTIPDASGTLAELTDKIDKAVLGKYFGEIWQPTTKSFKYSGLNLVEEIKNLHPRSVLDLGCGYNEFKKLIPNLIGVDPYNKNADLQIPLLEYKPQNKFDVVIALGSINFGSTDKIFRELEHAVSLCAEGGTMYFRVNPGLKHEPPESDWISFYDWDANFITNCADYFKVTTIQLRNDSKGRIYFVWRRS
tara:strand:+ start:91 stop:765 length:675 start_codon:yes stop_codon:yes gene_type:complete